MYLQGKVCLQAYCLCNHQVKVMVLILKQQQDISSLSEDVISLKGLVEKSTLAKKTHNKEEEIVQIITQDKDKVPDNVFKFKLCDFECPRQETLKKHTNTKHQSPNNEKAAERKFFCLECNVSFKTKKSLKKHEQSHDKTENMNVKNIEGSRNSISEHEEAPEVDEA